MALFHRFVNLFRRTSLLEDIDAELRAHIEMRAADNAAAGMPAEQAHRDAMVRFGNLSLTTERTGAMDVNRFFESLWRDIRYASRQLRRSPGFALTGILTIALAIAANAVVFSVVNSLVLKSLIPSGSERLFNIVQGPRGYDNQSYPDYLDYHNLNTTFRDLAAYRFNRAALTLQGAAYKCWDYEVSGNYFDLLGVQPELGRLFHSSDEHGPDSAPYVVLSDAFWRSHLAADPHIIGKAVHLNGHPFTIVGVAPAWFHGTDLFLWPDFWMPIVNERQVEGYDFFHSRYSHGTWVIGALKLGSTPQQAAQDLNAVAARLGKQYPLTDEGMTARLVKPGLMGDQLGDSARAFLSAIMILALLVLLAACVNLAGIFAARASDRSRELSIRLAIGSSRWHVLRQLLTEVVLLSLVGGFIGTMSAVVLLHFLSAWQPFAEFPIHVSVLPGARVYLVAAVLSLASGVLPGLLPARQLWKTDLVHAIKSIKVNPGGRRLSLRDLLLGTQIALCALLLTSSLVAVRGMERSLHAPLGFNPHGVVLAESDMNMANHSDEASLAIQKRIIDEATRIPGVLAAGIINGTPLGTRGSSTPVYSASTADFRPANIRTEASFYSISPDYLRAAGTHLLAGRTFTWHDNQHARSVALVNETLARALFGDSRALGRSFRTSPNSSYEIVGIVENGKYQFLTETPAAAMFLPLAQAPDSDTTLVVRSNLPASETAAYLNEIVRKIDPNLPFTIHSWPEALGLVLFPARAATASLGVMGLIAAMLAVTGVFGMAAYSVSKRKKEFGIRIALGTQSLRLIRTALARPIVLLLGGSALGLSLGLLATRLLGQIVYQATPRDPLVWSGVILSMALLGICATWIPARRALAVDPAKLLKEDM